MSMTIQIRDWNPDPIDPPTEEEKALYSLYHTNGEWPTDDEVADAIVDATFIPAGLGMRPTVNGDPAAYSVGLSTKFGEVGANIDKLGDEIIRLFPALRGVWDVRLALSAQVRERIREDRIFYGKEGAALEAAAERAVHTAMGDLLLEVYTRISGS